MCDFPSHKSGVKYPNGTGHNVSFGSQEDPNSYDVTNALHELYSNLGTLNNNTSVAITQADFIDGFTIFSYKFDLNTIQEDVISYDVGPGILSLSVKFAPVTEEPLSIFSFALVNGELFYYPDGTIVSSH